MPEGIIFMLVGLLGLMDTLSPQRLAQAQAYEDLLGFALYPGFLSVVLVIGGCVLCIRNRADLVKLRPLFSGNLHFPSARRVVSNLLTNKPIIAFSALYLYALVTPYLGYPLATLLFFYGVFGWQGYKWSLRNLLLSLIMAVAFTAFAHIADVPMPEGFVALL
jgi:hypothetical protein